MKEYILGISCFYHDSAAAIISDGEIVSAAQEERFTRKKHDSGFPKNAIIYCLNEQNLNISDLKCIVFYEKPLLTFERLLETYLTTSPRGLRSFISAMKVWLKEKIFTKSNIKKYFKKIQKQINPKDEGLPEILFSEHHLSHAASAFYPSPYKEAAILCMDGVGEWATTSVWHGKDNTLRPLWEINFPHSLGLIYSAFTYFCGFKVNSGEYKLMGLAPYGEPIYTEIIKNNLIDIKEDGTFKLDMKYFKFHRGFRMTSSEFYKLFNSPPRKPEAEMTQFYMDIASSIQEVINEIVIKLAETIKAETGLKNICLAGGVALNCVANGKLIEKKIFENVWVQPASGDAGGSLGAALSVWYLNFNKKRSIIRGKDSMKGSLLGCKFSNNEIVEYLQEINASYKTFEDSILFEKIAELLSEGKVIGWFNGAMEFGPRALGGRSILGDPRNEKMQKIMNLKIKYRESFRPFAPSVLEEHISDQFEMNVPSPYMLFVSPIKSELRKKISPEEKSLKGTKKLNVNRSLLPAITHVDYSARIQTVNEDINPRYYRLIKEFNTKTGCPTLINTSFNVRGEPIVCTPKDAFRCFMRTEMDALVLENQILFKKDQLKLKVIDDLESEFELD